VAASLQLAQHRQVTNLRHKALENADYSRIFMVSAFPCPHCQTLLTPASEAEFQVRCPTCAVSVSPPWVPALALEDAAAPVAVAAVEEAVPALVPVSAAPAAADDVPVLEAVDDDIPVAEVDVPAVAPPQSPKKGWDWTTIAPTETPAASRLSPGWRPIPFALTLVTVGSGILLVTLLFFLVLAAVAAQQVLPKEAANAPFQISMGTHHRTTIRGEVLLVMLGSALLVGGLFLVLGKLICCRVPRESNGRALAVLSALCLIVGLLTELEAAVLNLGLLASWPFVVELRQQYPDEVAAFASYGVLVGMAFHAVEVILFLLFVRGIGLFLADKRLPVSVVRYFKFTIFGPLLPALILGGAYLLTMPGANDLGLSHTERMLLIQLLLVLVPLALFAYIIALGVWYIMLVKSARDLVLKARLGRLG
jgi:hypothetical protein